MEMKDFFDFSSTLVSTTLLARLTDPNIDRLKLIKGDYQGIDFPITFKQEDGNKLRDILDTGYPSLYLISERMKQLLEEHQLTGWKVFPILLYDKKGKEIAGYHGFSITGQSGPISYKKSEIIERRHVPDGPFYTYYKGVTIDNWDGSDFFTPKRTYETCVTRKAADILKANKISNLRLKNFTESEINVRYVREDER